MTALAVIPARGGSKGVPGKNLALVGGVPLVVRAIRAALASGSVDTVAVSTDDDGIAAVAAAARAVQRAMSAGVTALCAAVAAAKPPHPSALTS